MRLSDRLLLLIKKKNRHVGFIGVICLPGRWNYEWISCKFNVLYLTTDSGIFSWSQIENSYRACCLTFKPISTSRLCNIVRSYSSAEKKMVLSFKLMNNITLKDLGTALISFEWFISLNYISLIHDMTFSNLFSFLEPLIHTDLKNLFVFKLQGVVWEIWGSHSLQAGLSVSSRGHEAGSFHTWRIFSTSDWQRM